MARITIEDCIRLVPNRFDLVLLASQRTREISGGAVILVPRDNDKNPVIALRELAEGKLSTGDLKREIIRSLQKMSEPEEAEEEIRIAIAEEQKGISVADLAEKEIESGSGLQIFEDETEIHE